MKNDIETQITEENLKFIVGDEFEKIMDIGRFNAYCSNCFKEKKEVEMVHYNISVNRINDVIFRGKCKSCNGKMARVIEIGDQEKFRIKTEIIKASKVNKN